MVFNDFFNNEFNKKEIDKKVNEITQKKTSSIQAAEEIFKNKK